MKWIALVFLSAGCASTPSTDYFNQPFEQWMPSEVRRFVIDAQACGHFSGEEPYDQERKVFLDRMIRKACTNIEGRKAALVKRFQDSPRIVTLLSEAWSGES